MPTIQFYHTPGSAPCRSVEFVAAMAGVTLERHFVDLMNKEHLTEKYLKINPAHKVPFIVDGDLSMGESRAIMAYLVTKYMPDNKTLYPSEPEKRAKVDELLQYDLGTLYPTGMTLFRPVLFSGATSFDPESEKAYRDILDTLDSHLAKGTKFYLGNDLTIADISLVSTLSYTEAFGLDISAHKNLVAYIKRVAGSIKNYDEVTKPAMEMMKNFIKSKRAGQ